MVLTVHHKHISYAHQCEESMCIQEKKNMSDPYWWPKEEDTYSHWQQTDIFQICTPDTPEGINLAENSAFYSDSLRENREDRSFVLGIAVWLRGSIDLTSRGLGLWSQKRHRREVRAGPNSLEMFYHHYRQGTVSHQGHEKLRGLECPCVCLWNCVLCWDMSAWMNKLRVTNITLLSGVFHLHADIVWFNLASVKDLSKAHCHCLVFSHPPSNQVQLVWGGEERREAMCWPVTLLVTISSSNSGQRFAAWYKFSITTSVC